MPFQWQKLICLRNLFASEVSCWPEMQLWVCHRIKSNAQIWVVVYMFAIRLLSFHLFMSSCVCVTFSQYWSWNYKLTHKCAARELLEFPISKSNVTTRILVQPGDVKNWSCFLVWQGDVSHFAYRHGQGFPSQLSHFIFQPTTCVSVWEMVWFQSLSSFLGRCLYVRPFIMTQIFCRQIKCGTWT